MFKISEVQPSFDDADANGDILCWSALSGFYVASWKSALKGPQHVYWMKLPAAPV